LELRADRTDRLMRLTFTAEGLCDQLQRGRRHVLVGNHPADCEIIYGHFYPNGAVIFIIRSQSFPRIVQGSLIPKFEPRLESRG
jgi:hypothetical protein